MADVLMLSVSGCRGVVGTTLTPAMVSRFAGTIGRFLRDERKPSGKAARRPLVVIARDGRAGGHMVRDAARAGLLASGCDVVDIGIAMTPSCAVSVDAIDADAGIVLTASHNPQQWNGLKFLLRARGKNSGLQNSSACAPPKPIADRVIGAFRETSGLEVDPTLVKWDEVGELEDAPTEGGFLHAARAADAIAGLGFTSAIKKRKFKVVLDCVNGAGRMISPSWLSATGCRVTALGDDDSGLFPHTPEPTRENLVSLTKAVKKAGADIGFAQDPDADRLAIVDERGQYIGEEYTLVLAAMALGEAGALKKNQTLVVNLSTSRMIEDIAARYGCHVQRAAVGEANVVELMKSLKSPLGGEGNGGVIWPKVTYIRDSLGAMGLVLGLMARSKKPLSEIVKTIPAYAITKRKVDLKDLADAKRAVGAISKHYASERLDQQDGVRVDFDSDRAWLHVRASNTEPIMRLIAEAPTQAMATKILDDAARVIG
ncbi:MAG: hypothetical protein K2X32_14240 [Phycisphaerales bacterium]|nr:hypothetical protein [Phycisphaerales bacterium]